MIEIILIDFQDLVEMTRMTLVGPNTELKLQSALETTMETTQDFTDSAYTSHENRERILLLCDQLRQELIILLRIGISLVKNMFKNLSLHGKCFVFSWHKSMFGK